LRAKKTAALASARERKQNPDFTLKELGKATFRGKNRIKDYSSKRTSRRLKTWNIDMGKAYIEDGDEENRSAEEGRV